MLTNYIKSKNYKKDDLYVSSGEKLYIIGSQDGLFPYFGRHSENEMGGIWAHPIKLMDGFWVRLTMDDQEIWLEEADEMVVYPYKTIFKYDLGSITVEREQFVPLKEAACFINFKIINIGSDCKSIKFEYFTKTELMPAWGSEEMGVYDHDDKAYWDHDKKLLIAQDEGNPHYVVCGSASSIEYVEINPDIRLIETTKGRGVVTLMQSNLVLDGASESNLSYIIAGSSVGLEEALATYEDVVYSYSSLLQQSVAHYEKVLSQSKLTLPDDLVQEVYDTTKINTQWLIRDVEGIGRGIGAGLPDYPWFFGCDNGYSVSALLAMGEFELAKSTLRILKDFSETVNGNGRIVHEISTSRHVYNVGNTQETPHFINAIWTYFEWTGDLEFLQEMYNISKKGIEWLMNEMDPDGDLLPSGYGIMEIAGLNAELIDTAVYFAEALKNVSKMANVFGEKELSQSLYDLHQKAISSIEENFWMAKDQLYADVVATPEAVKEAFPVFRERHNKILGGEKHHRLAKLDRLYNLFDQYEEGKEYPWLIFKNWVILTPLEVGYTDVERANKILDIMNTEEFVNDYGLYIEALARNFAMTISTGVQAVCEAVYGRTDQCVHHIKKLAKCLHKEMPLSMSELSPVGGCFVQEWTIYGTIWPIVRYLFGINPKSSERKLVLSPQMLAEWNEGALENVRIGAHSISLYFERQGKEEVFTIDKGGLDWEIEFQAIHSNQKLIVK